MARVTANVKEKIIYEYSNGVPTYLIAQKYNLTEAQVVRVLEKAGYIR